LGHAYGVAGRGDRAREKLDALHAAEARGQYVPAEYLAIVHLGLGNDEAALDRLRQALDQNSTAIVFLRIDPMVDPLRDHPRFTDLLRRAGLPTERSAVAR
jgi:hypothetical protein